MSQQVKQKAIAVSVAAALSAAGGIALAASTNTATLTGANVPLYKSNSTITTPSGFKVVESGNDWSSTGAFITLKLNAKINGEGTSLDNNVLTTVDALGASVAAIVASTATGTSVAFTRTASAADIVVKGSLDSGSLSLVRSPTDGSLGANNLTVGHLYGSATTRNLVLGIKGTASANDNFSLAFASLAPLSSTQTGAVTLTLADGDNAAATKLGITEGSLTLATLVNASVQLTASNTTPTVAASGSSTAQKVTGFKIAAVTGITSTAASASVLEISLNNGGKWFPTAATTTVVSVTNASVTTVTIGGTTNNTLRVQLGDKNDGGTRAFDGASATSATTIELKDAQQILDTGSVAAGSTLTATITASGNLATYSINNTYSAATTVASKVDVAYKDQDADGKVATYYLGRLVTVTDGLTATETTPGTITANTLYTVSLSNGAVFQSGAPLTVSADTSTSGLGANTVTTSDAVAATATATTSTASSTTKGTVTISGLKLDLANATAGDLNVTLAGANLSGTASKVATLVAATDTSASGTQPVLVAGGSAVALPDLVISEAAKGALDISTAIDAIALQLPSGYTFDSSVVPTVTVRDAAGTSKAIVTAPSIAHYSADARDYKVELSAAWDSSVNGPYKITVSGLKAKASSTTAASTSVALTVGGSDKAVTDTATSTPSSRIGASAYKQSVKVATSVDAANPVFGTVSTIADITKATITGVPLTASGNDQGKPGAIYVAAIINGQVFFMDSAGAFALYTGSTSPKAYFTGNLGTHSIDVLKTAFDLTTFKGTQLVVGYGIGITGLSDPFQNMLTNGRYNIIYTVPR